MSFVKYKWNIEDGDSVILFLGHDNMLTLKVKAGETHQTKYGALRHSDLIGKQYGCKFQCKQGYLHVLHLTPELWTLNLPHRTQILYSTDISMIVMQLDLQPGSVVIESGTGSGSLSHAIIRTIAPSGHLHTFDFHEERVQKAGEEFSNHGVASLVTCRCRDACTQGFDLEAVADAVFLDLPKPWDALPHAAKALKQGGRICSFSPCIEQVQRSCTKMRDLGFTDIDTMECLLRTFEVRTNSFPVANMGQSHTSKNINSKDTSESPKRLKRDQSAVSSQSDDTLQRPDSQSDDTSQTAKSKSGDTSRTASSQSAGSSYEFASGFPRAAMPGHTGYVTFATFITE